MLTKRTVLGVLLCGFLTGPAHAGVLQPPSDNTGFGGVDLSGYQVVYLFTGSINFTGLAAITVHCTNVGKEDTLVAVEYFDRDGDFLGDVLVSIAVEQSRTISSASTFYQETVSTLGSSNEVGSGRILVADKDASLLCAAQVIEPGNIATVPSFVSDLPLLPVSKPPKVKIKN